jgi:type I restriction enzyme, S subunit
MCNQQIPSRPTPWGPRPSDWEIRPWSAFASRAGEPVIVHPGRQYKQVTVRVRHQGVSQRQIDDRRNHKILSPNQTVVRGGQFIISKIDARNGACGFIPHDLDGAIVTNDFPVYELGCDVEPRFIDYVVAQEHFWYLCALASEGTTNRVRLSSERFEELEFVLPPLPEQRRIAEILSSVDEAIEQTEAVIERVQEVKRALAQELLTRGMPGRHTRFKQTEVGEIPECWEVVRLGDVARVQSGIAKNEKARRANPVTLPYLRVANVQDGYIDLSEVKSITVDAADVPRCSLHPGDVLFTEGGDFDKLGRGAVWAAPIFPCVHQNHVFAVRPETGRLSPEYLAMYAASHAGKRYFLRASKQTTNLASVNATQLRLLPVALPSIEEQESIVCAVNRSDERVGSESSRLQELKSVKAMLAGALLTGRIRTIPMADLATAAEVAK